MSKINKLRFVNLNYNHNTMRIDDETFYLDGENTMLNLRNGGGKSVLVQMVMAPLVNKRYRSLKDRTFESYFTTSTPTYIMIEWQLDDGAGYLLTGMMVRKKEVSSDQDSKDKLDIINFIHEYKEKNAYDINSIPIVENSSNKKVVKSFFNSKKIFEELKKHRDFKFNYYDMNNSTTTKNYFEKLQEYKINNKEWETIIKQINLKESGLSELFIKAKDSSGLVKSWFLPAIENKLKKDEDRIKNYRDLVQRYIEQYRANKANIDKKEKIEFFNKLSEDIIIKCDEFIKTIEERKELENKIANIIKFLNNAYKNKGREEEELENLINQLLEKINDLIYEEYSIKIYNKEDVIENLKVEEEELNSLVKKSEEENKLLTKKIEILECSRVHKEYTRISQELQSLEAEIKLLDKKKEDNEPLIKNIGFTIREILNKEVDGLKEKIQERKEEVCNLENEKEWTKNILSKNREEINQLKGEEGFLRANLESFDKVENDFNDKYDENINRNIEGYFDEEKLAFLEKSINDYSFDLNKDIKSVMEDILLSKETLNSKKNEKERNTTLKFEFENKFKNNKNTIEELDIKIKECIDVIKYIDFSEERVFDTDEILNAFNMKIDFLEKEKNKLLKIEENLLYELEKLEGGKVLELSKEIKKKLSDKDIKITYGMEWLKKNGYSANKNMEIVNRNPFIPYSLIMSSNDIDILKKESLDIFTSNPISIINRIDLENEFLDIEQDIVSLDKVNFFVSFNNKLLDEEELLKLINKKKENLESIRKDIDNKKCEIKFYDGKREIIQLSRLDKKEYENLKEESEVLNKKLIELRENELDITREISKIERNILELENVKKDLEEKARKNNEKISSFNELVLEYGNYKENKNKLNLIEEEYESIKKVLKENENKEIDVDRSLKDINNIILNYNSSLRRLNNELIEFSSYNEGIFIKKDKEDLLAEFSVLNKNITSSEKELKKKKEEKSRTFKEIEDELDSKSKKYNVLEAEYVNEIYNIDKEFELKDLLEKENKNCDQLKDKVSKSVRSLDGEKIRLENLYESLKKELGEVKAKSRDLLYNKNFKEKIAKLKVEKISNENKIKEIIAEKNKLEKYLIDLSQFNDFIIEDEDDIFIDIKELDRVVGTVKRDLAEKKDLELKNESSLANCVIDIENKDTFRNETLFENAIQSLKTLFSKPIQFKEHLNLVTDSYNSIIEKLLIDIKLIEDEEEKILGSILEYIEEVNKNIDRIDENSSINIGNKRVKMLNITVDDFEKNKINYNLKLRDYVEAIRDRCIEELEKNNSIEEIISNTINSFKLYDEIVGVENVDIKLYKIEENRQRIISWEDVSKNSGGEGFLSAFVILSSLLSYMRKDENDIFSRKEDGKVLIMDNPFAQTSSSHLLKPLMDIAKKSNTQLICLTGLGGDSIYNRFNNIYLLNLVSSKLNNNVKYIKSEHIKGDEEKETEVIVSSRFKIEEQTRLF